MTGCVNRRSTFTTTVLVFLSLTTTPCSTRFGIRSSFFLSASLAALLRQNRFYARNGPADFTHAICLLELSVRALKAKIERLLLQLDELVTQFVCRLGAKIIGLRRCFCRRLGRLCSLCRLGLFRLSRGYRLRGFSRRHRLKHPCARQTSSRSKVSPSRGAWLPSPSQDRPRRS